MSDEERQYTPAPDLEPPAAPAEPEVETSDVHTIALEVLAGQWSRGHVRRARLEKAGHNVDEVYAEVNKILHR